LNPTTSYIAGVEYIVVDVESCSKTACLYADGCYRGLRLLSEGNGRRGLFAGGTDMIPYIRRGRVSLEEVIDLSGVQGLSFVKFEDGVFRVGALTTVQELAESPLIPERYQSIKGLVYYFGAETTRNMATVGGNLASGGERDIPAVLTSLDGWVEVASLEGVRRAHPLQLELKPWELIIEAAFNDWGEGQCFMV
jgi:CO/xanthine dehydrogenase FAD-binding subunit